MSTQLVLNIMYIYVSWNTFNNSLILTNQGRFWTQLVRTHKHHRYVCIMVYLTLLWYGEKNPIYALYHLYLGQFPYWVNCILQSNHEALCSHVPGPDAGDGSGGDLVEIAGNHDGLYWFCLNCIAFLTFSVRFWFSNFHITICLGAIVLKIFDIFEIKFALIR